MKTEINTILLATNFRPGSRRTLDYAVSLAKRLKAKLVIVNAFELDPEANSVELADHMPSRTRLEAAAQLHLFVESSNRAGVLADSALVEGVVPDAILRAIKTFQADLLVLGTKEGHRGLGHFLIGSNAESLLERASCPTMVVGPHAPMDADANALFRKIMYISNLRPAAAAAAPFALALGKALGIDTEICQVVRDAPQGKPDVPLKKRVDAYCTALGTMLPEVESEWCSADFQMGRAVSPQAVLEMSRNPSVLMVVGVPHAPFLERHLRLSYPFRLLETAACPIITVRSEVSGAEEHGVKPNASV
jgi:nucleotide-binding universal stress UspA family protein